MDNEQSQRGKRARRKISDILQSYYNFWLQHFENENEQFVEQVIRFAQQKIRSPQAGGVL
jgi:hypothetical protein